ncbi:MAG: rRNA maturation RNase YbeY [Ignavibacteria bacterium]|nr:MAG: rRNA maturation RNase YbeY [Ignavibacteria bacterium]
MKNLRVYLHSKAKLDKREVHKIVKNITSYLDLKIISLEINFMNSEQIHKMNVEHLGHDYSTDIITFNYSEELSKLDGEIFISLEDAKFNSKKFDVLFENEVVRLIIHGILHMIGYDDQKPADKRKMKKKENELVAKIWNRSFKGFVKL